MKKISTKQIATAIYKATNLKQDNEISLILKNAVKMIANKNLISKSNEILDYLQDIYDQKEGIIRAKIFSAKNLDNVEKQKIEDNLKTKYKTEKIISEYFEKKELLGGIRIEVGNEVLDNTYKNRLYQLEKHLIKSK